MTNQEAFVVTARNVCVAVSGVLIAMMMPGTYSAWALLGFVFLRSAPVNGKPRPRPPA